MVTLPLIALAIPSIFAGFILTQPLLFGGFFTELNSVQHAGHDAMRVLAQDWHGWFAYGLHAVMTLPFYLAIGGIVITWYCYVINPKAPAAVEKALSFLKPVFDHKYYFDWLNEKVIARFARWFGNELWVKFDQGLIDGVFVNGSTKVVAAFAAVSRRMQTGYIYHYAFLMIIGLVALITFILVTK